MSSSAAGTSSSDGSSRPSLLAGLTSMQLPLASGDNQDASVGAGSSLVTTIPPRPRRLWKIHDTHSLKPVPTFYPPLSAQTTCFISDAPPSVVAVRIAECLTRRSVSVEYDEESATATCMTMDRCHFIVQLWRGAKQQGQGSTSSSSQQQKSSSTTAKGSAAAAAPVNNTTSGDDSNNMSVAHDLLSMSLRSTDDTNAPNTASTTSKPDFSHGIIVEVMRLRGDVMTYHRNVQAILAAAQSHDAGTDRRGILNKPQLSSPREFPRWTAHAHAFSGSLLSTSTASTATSTASPSSSPKSKKSKKKMNAATNNNNINSDGVSSSAGSRHSNNATTTTMKLPPPPSNGLLQPKQKITMEQASTRAILGMEQAMELLRKDRLDAQVLGMERLVALTDRDSSGNEIAMYTALTLVGAPIIVNKKGNGNSTADDSAKEKQDTTAGVAALRELHQDWIIGVIVHRQLPGQSEAALAAEKAANLAAAEAADAAIQQGGGGDSSSSSPPRAPKSFSGCAHSLLKDVNATAAVAAHAGAAGNNNSTSPQHYHQHSSDQSESMRVERELEKIRLERIRAGDEHHGGTIRSMSLRCLANGLSILAELQPKLLPQILTTQAPQLASKEMLKALVEDLEGGASRPPGVAVTGGSQLASQHEAALAIRCLRIVGEFNVTAKKRLLNPKKLALLPLLEKARIVGQATHVILEQEAQQAYLALTEADRSC